MNITKEQMLKWLWDKQIEADDLMEGDEFNMVVAIRALIESSGDKEQETDPFLSNLYGVKSAPSPGEKQDMVEGPLGEFIPRCSPAPLLEEEFEKRYGKYAKKDVTQFVHPDGEIDWVKSAPSPGEGIKPDPAPSPGPSADRVVAYYEAARNWFCDFYYWATHDMQGNPAHTEMNDGMFRAVYGAICSKRDEKPAPLPKEVEEAMETLKDFVNETRGWTSLYNFQQRVDAALAVLKSALRPRVVSREWVGELVEVARWGDKDGGYARVKSRLCSELGVVVGD